MSRVKLMLALKFGLFLFLGIMSVGNSWAATDSKGTEFYFSFMPNTSRTASLFLYITSEEATQGTVSIDGLGVIETFQTVANETTTVALPSAAQSLPVNQVSNYGVHVVADKEVTVYGLNRLQNSTDAFLGLPVDTLGVNYILSAFPPHLWYEAESVITGVYDNTVITVIPAGEFDGHEAKVPFDITLNRGETYLLKASGRGYTGTEVISTAPISVAAGTECSFIPENYGYCDHLVELLPPVSTWGKQVLTYPLAMREKGDLFRILASQDDTTVSINDAETVSLNKGEFYENIFTEALDIEADKPILVTQFSLGQDFDDVVSDPFMMFIPPQEQFLSDYTFTALAPELNVENNFVNVLISTTQINTLSLDEAPVDSSLFRTIGQTGYSGAQIPVEPGSHHISSENPFGIFVYGFGSYESYGYPGGLSLERINPVGDHYAPNILLQKYNNVYTGLAGDNEDLNLNEVLDAGEDVNQNGILDARAEDINGNGLLDPGEDSNNDGILDKDTGIAKIELSQGSDNLKLEAANFVPGTEKVSFSITLDNPDKIGSGILSVTDMAGNVTEEEIILSDITYWSNVEVISSLSTNEIEPVMGSFMKMPSDIQYYSDKTEFIWRYVAFAVDQQADLGYQVILKNPQPNEERVVTQALSINYIDTNGQRVSLDLGEQKVKVAPTAFTVRGETDKSVYTRAETIVSTVNVTNTAPTEAITHIRASLLDENGELVTRLLDLPNLAFTAGEQKAFADLSFAGSNVLPGDYQLVAELLDEQGLVLTSDTSDFKMESISEQVLALRTTTNKPVYHTTDVVILENLVRNLTEDISIKSASLSVIVNNPISEQVFNQTIALGNLPAGAIRTVNLPYGFQGALQGTYTVIGQVFNGEEELLIQSETQYEVVEQLIQSLVGGVEVFDHEIDIGDHQSCTNSIKNTGVMDLHALKIRSILLNISAGVEAGSIENTIDMAAGETKTFDRVIDTSVLQDAYYNCVLQVEVGGQWETLAYDYFKSGGAAPNHPPVAVDDELSTRRGAWGSVNVLVNDHDPDGDALTVTLLTEPEHGYLTDLGNGSYNFFPDFTYIGPDSFNYRIDDHKGGNDTARVLIDVTPGLSCSKVPDHSTAQPGFVELPNWARDMRENIDPPKYYIDITGVSDPALFDGETGQPKIDYPACTLSYKPKKNGTTKVSFIVRDADTDGQRYTSRDKHFTIEISGQGTFNLAPIIQLLLLDDACEKLPGEETCK